MDRSHVLRLVLFACCTALLAADVRPATAAAPVRAKHPNVILILTDDQGYGDLGCHGNPVLKTPYLDKLHGESIRLTDFHVAPMCTPTRGQLMTGRDALHNGAYCVSNGRTFIRHGIPTMADIFARGGYRTGIFGKWHLGDNYPHRPRDRGFQEALHHLGWGITSTPEFWNNDYFDDHFIHNGQLKQYKGYCTDVWFRQASKWITECASRGEPFLAYIATNAPHAPFWAPKKDRQAYKQLDRDTGGFFAMIANLDTNIARLDAMLEATGLRENTILIYMTDNGGTGGIGVYNAGMRGAKASLYEGGHRVPCFIRYPQGRLRPAGDVDQLTQVQDILPTLVELCRLKSAEGAKFDGVSLVPLLRGRPQPELVERMLVAQYGRLDPTQPQAWDSTVLWRKWRLVKGKELYDVGADPGQKKDVAADNPELVEKMRTHYQQWWDAVEPSLSTYETITVGSDRENPVRLSSLDWLLPKLTVAAQIIDVRLLGKVPFKEGALPGGRPNPMLNGPWSILVDRAGQYEIELRRWPKEADAAITATLPPYEGVDGTFPAGLPVPAAKARLTVAGVDVSAPVAAEDKTVRFTVQLPAGKTQLQTWFYDADGKELCGAFYVTVRRL